MNWLLLPEDEVQLVTYLTGPLGLRMVLPKLTSAGVALAKDPLTALTSELPGHVTEGIPWDFTFWCPDIGPMRLLGDRPSEGHDDVRTRVALQMTKVESPRWRELLDLRRTPVIRFRRSAWHQEGPLMPGLLQGMDLTVKEHPSDVIRLLRSITSWLKREGEKLNPFEHCSNSPIPQPRNLNPFWVWARPCALSWVRAGGEVWPWNA